MLLNFAVENYKSFLDKAEFKMIPAPKQHGLDYSILSEKTKGSNIKGLCSSVVYGPNAAGKTNIIGAMDVFRSLVLRGNVRNSEDQSSPNRAAYDLELIPNNHLDCEEPVSFFIEFVENSKKYSYELSVRLGRFLDIDYERKIVHEKLAIDDEAVFLRNDNVTFGSKKTLKKYLSKTLLEKMDMVYYVANLGLADDELFLMNSFKIIAKDISQTIYNWFSEKFMVIYRADAIQLIKRFSDPQNKTVFIEKTTAEAATLFGINSNSVGYVAQGDDSEAKLFSLFQKSDNQAKAVLAEVFESFGTIRFINLFPLVIRAIMTGGTLVVDEFDASIHPMALMSILNIFHNDEINIKNAQLIFNTHNPIFLNSNILRRDEIKFVEKDDDTLLSEIYSLSDFGTSGENGVRKGEDYMKSYFVSKYGAIKDIDFSPIFEELLQEEGIYGE